MSPRSGKSARTWNGPKPAGFNRTSSPSFFIEAFKLLGGTHPRTRAKRYEIKHVPAVIRNRDREIGRGQAVLPRYERITFEKDLISLPGKPLAAFVCPGHPLLDATLDLIIERHRDLLKRGAILIDDTDEGRPAARWSTWNTRSRMPRPTGPAIAASSPSGCNSSKWTNGNTTNAGPGPVSRLSAADRRRVSSCLRKHCRRPIGFASDLESQAMEHAAIHLVPQHLDEVRHRKEELIDKTKAAVQDRLTKEINYWDHRAAQLKDQELGSHGISTAMPGAKRERRGDDEPGNHRLLR